jgi:hypothetical protein
MKHLKLYEHFNENKKIIHYTQYGLNKEKINRLIKIVNEKWISENPVAFEIFNNELYLTEGHHRFEACLRKKDKNLLKSLFNRALYYKINYKPRSFKKIVINL